MNPLCFIVRLDSLTLHNPSSLCNRSGLGVYTQESGPALNACLLGHGCTDLVMRYRKLWTVRIAVAVHVAIAVHVVVVAVAAFFGIERLCHLQMFPQSRECRSCKRF